ncbi:unnamed protein product [Eruca vesicaria subsp. sativa]|uniref:Uncharacterized protein n=1 Tax=Eruca vesicaria subsp. sativa TaxID=29727 RepID=A0ABC8K4F7_ERUVS|nr:unnamed protein product [Eruca vesicaria subsp. sativa]
MEDDVEEKVEEADRLLPPQSLPSNSSSYESRDKIVIVDFESAEDPAPAPPPFSWRKLWHRRLLSPMALNVGHRHGILIQMLSARLGVATGKHLAELCHHEYPTWARYLLVSMAELALIAADIQEVIRSAIAIQILSRGVLPLRAGVVITACRGKSTQRGNHGFKRRLFYYLIESSVALFISFMIHLFVTTVFAKGFYGTEKANNMGLVNAGQYLQDKFGGGLLPVLYIWGIAVVNSRTKQYHITGTYAGQFIMGGFLNLRLKKWMRAVITRSCAIVPTMIVAIVFNTSEASLDVLNEWLNVLQSVQIPFPLLPLLTLVSKEETMGDFKIGPILQRIAWTVAALVMIINGYLLLDFFVSEVNGFMFGVTR